jgi:hypothetical protein
MKNRRILFLVSLLLLTVMFSIPSSAKIITIATDPMGTNTYGATAGYATIINKYNTVGLNVKVKPTTGSMDIAGLLATGEVQLGVHNNFDAQASWLTKGDFQVNDQITKVIPLRLLTSGSTVFNAPLTTMDSGILSAADIKGKRFAGEYSAGPQDTAQSLGFLAGWGLTKEDVIWITVPDLADAIVLLMEGKADVAGDSGPGMAQVLELDTKKGARFLSYNTTPEGVEAFNKIYQAPVSFTVVDPDPSLVGVRERINMLKQDDYYMARLDQISEEEAYSIVKCIWDNLEEFRVLHSSLASLRKPEFLIIGGDFSVPYHPGAIKFYKEKGAWTQALEDRNNELLALEAEEMK